MKSETHNQATGNEKGEKIMKTTTITRNDIASTFDDILDFMLAGNARQHNPVVAIEKNGTVHVTSGLHTDHVWECDLQDAANWFDGAANDETGANIVASMTDHEIAAWFGLHIDGLMIEA